MTSYRDRQRAAARARLEREMTQRAQTAQRRRRRLQIILAGSVSFVVIVGVVVLIVALGSGGDGKKSDAGASTAPCAFSPIETPSVSAGQSPETIPSEFKDVGLPPQDSVVRKGVQLMTMNTNLGAIQIQLDTAKAPCTAASFTYLAGKKFFDNTKCHRLTTAGIYVLQCGDPSSTGIGGPRYRVPDENLPTNNRPPYPEGVIAMANTGSANTGGSQFFIVYKDSELPAQYAVIGHVLQGLDIVKRVADAGVVVAEGGQEGDGAPKTPVAIATLTVSPPADSLPSLPAPSTGSSAAASASSTAPKSSSAAG